jgi:hypothetical protein
MRDQRCKQERSALALVFVYLVLTHSLTHAVVGAPRITAVLTLQWGRVSYLPMVLLLVLVARVNERALR